MAVVAVSGAVYVTLTPSEYTPPVDTTGNASAGFQYEITTRRVYARELPYSVDAQMFDRELRG